MVIQMLIRTYMARCTLYVVHAFICVSVDVCVYDECIKIQKPSRCKLTTKTAVKRLCLLLYTIDLPANGADRRLVNEIEM